MKKTLLILLVVIGLSTASVVAALEATESAVSEDEVRESLQDRLRQAAEEKGEQASQVLGAKKKTAVVGKLADIANKTLTITTRDESQELAAVSGETTLVRNGKKVKLTDIQIGDFVIAMGYMNGDSVLEAKRVVATDKPKTRPARTILRVTVGQVNKKSFTATDGRPVELGGPDTFTITVPRTSDLDLVDLEEGKQMVIIGTPDKDDEFSLTLRVYKLIE